MPARRRSGNGLHGDRRAARGRRQRGPHLGHGDDQATPVEDSLAAADSLRARGGEVETHVFEGAPHSFFDRTFDEHAQDCEEAWRLLLGFAERHAVGVRPR